MFIFLRSKFMKLVIGDLVMSNDKKDFGVVVKVDSEPLFGSDWARLVTVLWQAGNSEKLLCTQMQKVNA